MAKYTGFVFFTVPITYWGKYTKQLLYNEYYFETLGRINNHMVKNNLTFEWKLESIDHLESLVGKPINLKWWQKILEKTPFTQF